MQSLMNFEPPSPGVPFGAPWMRTDKRLLSCVGQFVGLQMALGDKLLVALRAHEGPLACVRAHVGLEISGLRELLEALLKGADKHLFLFLGALDLFDLGYKMSPISPVSKARNNWYKIYLTRSISPGFQLRRSLVG